MDQEQTLVHDDGGVDGWTDADGTISSCDRRTVHPVNTAVHSIFGRPISSPVSCLFCLFFTHSAQN